VFCYSINELQYPSPDYITSLSTTLTEQICAALTAYTFIGEVLGSNLDRDVGYSDRKFSCIPRFLQTNSRRVSGLGQFSISSKSFPTNCSLVNLPFKAAQSHILTASQNELLYKSQHYTELVHENLCGYVAVGDGGQLCRSIVYTALRHKNETDQFAVRFLRLSTQL
jgi:hypothetical protein